MSDVQTYSETVEVQWIAEDQNLGQLIGLLVNKVLAENGARDYNTVSVRAKSKIKGKVLCEVRVLWRG
jgi:hypothetical protein